MTSIMRIVFMALSSSKRVSHCVGAESKLLAKLNRTQPEERAGCACVVSRNDTTPSFDEMVGRVAYASATDRSVGSVDSPPCSDCSLFSRGWRWK